MAIVGKEWNLKNQSAIRKCLSIFVGLSYFGSNGDIVQFVQVILQGGVFG